MRERETDGQREGEGGKEAGRKKLHEFRKMDKERAQMLSITKSHFRCAWTFSIPIFIALLSTKMRGFFFMLALAYLYSVRGGIESMITEFN